MDNKFIPIHMQSHRVRLHSMTERVTEIFKYILWVYLDETKIAPPALRGVAPKGAAPQAQEFNRE